MSKRVWCVAIALLCLCSSAALALAPMGPPIAGLQKGQFSAGAEYSYGEMDIDVDPGPIGDLLGTSMGTVTIPDVETQVIAGNIGYGVLDNWEAFVRLGAAGAEFDDFSGDTQFYWAVGTKVTLIEDETLPWGALFQIGWLQSEDTVCWDMDGSDLDGTAELDVYEIQIAVGPTYKMDKISIYGGPFLHLVDGDLDLKGTLEGVGPGSVSLDVEQASEFGGYVGGQIELAANAGCNVEYQLTGDAWGIGAGLVWKF